MKEIIENGIIYGGDYNPEQWLHMPEILERDVEYLKLAHCNGVTMGIFSWSALEPEEGVYQFDWLEERIETMGKQGIQVILATPSGGRPKWLSDRYPEVLRVDEYGRRNYFGRRHNHCYTSPVYREKVRAVNMELARRLGHHPNIKLWHISNEYSGQCFCPLCQEEFRQYLKQKYETIGQLNLAWNTAFWSHTYQSFEQIEAPSAGGENAMHGLILEWKRFVTHQTRAFLDWEIQAIRSGGSDKPVTTNLMYDYDGLDYRELAKSLDIVSWDTYPAWHKNEVSQTALDCGMQHDLIRSLKKDTPFLLMESCPGSTNWQPVSKLKKPGMNELSAIQAVAHGSDSVLYFQVRQSRGASEKFHGAVIDHYGGCDTRIFQEVAQTGRILEGLREVAGSVCHAKAAVFYDWNNRWALNDAQGPRNQSMFYKECVQKTYNGLRRLGVNVDFVGLEDELEGYEILVIPMGYMMTDTFADRVRSFVDAGNTLVTTYWTGVVDRNDLCHLGGWPHGLMDVLGLRTEEIDGLYDWEENTLVPTVNGTEFGIEKSFHCRHLCELVGLSGAEALMVYGSDFYEGRPALTSHHFGNGHAYHVCCDADEEFYTELFRVLGKRHGFLNHEIESIPDGVEISERVSEICRYCFIQNFNQDAVRLDWDSSEWEILYMPLGFERDDSGMRIPGYDSVILKRCAKQF